MSMFMPSLPATANPWASGQTKVPAHDPHLPAGADLVFAELAKANGARQAREADMHELFQHYAEIHEEPGLALRWLQADGIPGRILDAIPHGRERALAYAHKELGDAEHKASFLGDLDKCEKNARDYAETSCRRGELPDGGIVHNRTECERIWREGRRGAGVSFAEGSQQSRTKTHQEGFASGGTVGVPGLGGANAADTIQDGQSETDGTSSQVSRSSTREAIKGYRQRCMESDLKKVHYGEVE